MININNEQIAREFQRSLVEYIAIPKRKCEQSWYVLLFSFWASLFSGFWVHYAYLTPTTRMRAKQSQAPERAEGKLLPEGMSLMAVSEDERLIIEMLRVEELELDTEAFDHWVLKAMLEVETRHKISTKRLEHLTGITHQHHLKLHPSDADAAEPHLSLFTFIRWCGGLRVSALRFLLLVIKRLTQKRPLRQQQ
jgi:hypothetical protein